MNTALRLKDPSGAWRQLSVGQAVVEASEHLKQGDDESALKLLEKAVEHAPGVPVFRYLLGITEVRRKLYTRAVANLEIVVRSDEQNVDYLIALAEALMAERPLDAISKFTRAAAMGSKNPLAYSKLAELLVNEQKPEEALSVCERGLALCDGNPEILRSRGLALKALGRSDDALECLLKVETLLPADTTTITGIAGVLLDLGRVPRARRYLERAVALDPGDASGHYNLGIALLLEGNYRDGFREYEFRWGVRNLIKQKPVFPRPQWDGSVLNGSRILLHAEQGAGDAIQFVRYADAVTARGGRVILAARAPLTRLLSWLENCEVAAVDAPLPPYDLHCPLLSLPGVLGTDKDSIPPPARFVIPAPIKHRWSGILGEKKGFRVGIVWAGSPGHQNDRNRSLSCRMFEPLPRIPQTEWFSLQVGPAAEQLTESGMRDRIRDLSSELTDYAETAAALSQLDLVITADTSVAHLAGSIGTPVWMLTPFAPDWRWMLEREDSPWYPSMRLFRQQVAGDWEGVMNAAAEALRQRLGAEPAGAPAIRKVSGQTDLVRWSNTANLDPAWDDRARLAADFIPAGANVLDLGCGRMALERYLPPGCRYTPCDVVRRDERTLLCNFNEQPIPRLPGATHITTLGVLEYIHDWRNFLQQLRAFNIPVVLSYCPTDFTSHLNREALGWINHLSLQDLCAEFSGAGFHLQSSMRPDGNQVLLRIVPAEARLPVRNRVLVMSYNNCGNFGDRLGFHLINSLMPAGAEVHHAHFQPWDVPPEDFDLLVLGIGNSIFHPILTDQLLELTRRIPHSVGIFGTQYREAIDRSRMSELLDRLTVWFARYEEDLLLYGRGRKNAVHLGDWLISAFPMTRWNRDETLHVGREIWNDLPLDRTIQGIQRYRNVVSERIHPLLCALSSAERVAYTEQREDGSGMNSGKFRSMLVDIFGRTWPESALFEVPRDAVAAYRARSMRVMSGMPRLFEQLLSSSGRATAV